MNIFEKRYESFGCQISPVELRQAIRVNTLKIDEHKLIKRLEREKVQLEKIPWLKYGYYADAEFSIGSTPEYLMGYYYKQEAASQFPVQVLNPNKEEFVLDMSAAPGGKTTQISQYMENQGKIIAVDIETHRLNALKNNLERLGIKNVIVVRKDARFIDDLGFLFDKILLDAPCAGNYAKDAEWFEKKTVEGFLERQNLQKELLKSAIRVLKKNGVLVYSTCSLEPEEDEVVIEWALKKFQDIKLEEIEYNLGDNGLTEIFGQKLDPEIKKCKRFWPNRTGTQGFFVAKIRKIE
jgi:tRNA (cytosine40_48-C5)-methyltransferase